jgi:hypothetical protein
MQELKIKAIGSDSGNRRWFYLARIVTRGKIEGSGMAAHILSEMEMNLMQEDLAKWRATPRVATMRVIPVAGKDSMLLNLSGAHSPYFTRNIVVLTDSSGRTGVAEVPGGEKIRKVLEEARVLVVGAEIGTCREVVRKNLKAAFHAHDCTKNPLARKKFHVDLIQAAARLGNRRVGRVARP